MADLPPLSYVRPRSLAEAAAAIARPGACIYAGGTELLVALAERRPWTRSVREIVDVKSLTAARSIRRSGDHLRIGALTTTAELAASPLVRRWAPALAEAAAATAAPALRRRATIGGNVATPAGDVTTALLALDATVDVLHGGRTRTEPLAAFMAAQASAWPRQRLIVAMRLGRNPRSAFEKEGLRSGFSRALASVAVARDGDRVTVALGGLRDRPFVATTVAAAVVGGGDVHAALATDCRPPDDGIVSPAYRLRLAERLLARALGRVMPR